MPNDSAAWRADPDVQTMERLREGEIDAFQVLFRKHFSAITRLAYRFLHSRERAEEVAQTVFLRLFQARGRYEAKARFSTYLYRIATNACLNELRRLERSQEVTSFDAHADPRAASVADRYPDRESSGPGQVFSCRETAVGIMTVIERMPSSQRNALLLKRVEGLSYQEVARSLGSSPGAVKSLISRATKRLRRDLAEVF